MEWRNGRKNGMRKLMVVGEKSHATWRVVFSKMSVLAAS